MRRAFVTDALFVFVAHTVLCTLVRAHGFDHVSDDDFARVTIAQTFAHSPRLDPTGTSWLPFPFWFLGSAMAAFGRSLACARLASIALSSAAAAFVTVALRASGATRTSTVVALVLMFLSPWSLWLGASTVPESFTASFACAAALGLGGPQIASIGKPFRFACAVALFAACASRYEPWPVAAVLGVVLLVRARGGDRSHLGLLAAIVILGPLAWMAWNLHAHGSMIHFLHRVASYKRAIGDGSTDTPSALLFYPRLLLRMRADVVAAFACALPLLRKPEIRARWIVPLACIAAELAFLAVGNARDGAPAHHPERALLGVVFLMAAFSGDALANTLPTFFRRARSATVALTTVLVVGWIANVRPVFGTPPGTNATEDRAAQIAEGTRLKTENVTGVVVVPCAYEHFALMAAYEAPERVEVLPSIGGVVDATCPRVARR